VSLVNFERSQDGLKQSSWYSRFANFTIMYLKFNINSSLLQISFAKQD